MAETIREVLRKHFRGDHHAGAYSLMVAYRAVLKALDKLDERIRSYNLSREQSINAQLDDMGLIWCGVQETHQGGFVEGRLADSSLVMYHPIERDNTTGWFSTSEPSVSSGYAVVRACPGCLEQLGGSAIPLERVRAGYKVVSSGRVIDPSLVDYYSVLPKSGALLSRDVDVPPDVAVEIFDGYVQLKVDDDLLPGYEFCP